MRQLGGQFSAARLLQALTLLQSTAAELPRSCNRRTDAELCLIRLCDESLDGSAAGLSARVARLEELLAGGAPVPAAPPPSTPTAPSVPAGPAPSPAEDPPPWDDRPPLPEEPPEEPERVFDVPVEAPAPAPAPVPGSGGGDRSFWPAFAAGLKGKVSPSVLPYLHNPSKVTGVWKNGQLDVYKRQACSTPAHSRWRWHPAQLRWGPLGW